MRGLPASAAALLLAALLGGCTEGVAYRQAVCALVDVSGTYADERVEAVRTLKREVLPAMVPGDTLVVIRIDGASYDRDDVVARSTLDARPSRANAQKLALARRLDALAEGAPAAAHTDLAGAMRNDPFVMKRTILDLLRLGVDPDDVRAVVYGNQRELLGIE